MILKVMISQVLFILPRHCVNVLILLVAMKIMLLGTQRIIVIVIACIIVMLTTVTIILVVINLFPQSR